MKKILLGIAPRTTLIYMIVAGLWIVLSDRVLDSILPTKETYVNWQTVKGLLFVTVTGSLLYFSLRTQLKRLQQEKAYRQQTETRFFNLLAVSTDAVISLDRDQTITYFNLGAEKIFGYEADEALGQPLDILLPERFAAAHRELVRQFGEGPEDAVVMRPIAGRRKNGEEFTAEATATKYRDGDTTTFTVILRDVEERERAEKATRRHLARANALTEIAARINEALDLPVVLNSICKELASALGVQIVMVALLEPRGEAINLAASYGLADKKKVKPVPAEKYIQNARELGPVAFLPDLDEASKVIGLDLARELGVHAVAVANMFEEREFFGALIAMTTDAARNFDEDDTQVMKGVADLAASAIKNASLYAKATQRLENLRALRAIDTAITGSLDLHVILKVLLDQVVSQLSIEAACVYLLNEATSVLEFHSGTADDPAIFSGDDIRLGEGMTGKIALEKRPISLKDISLARGWMHPKMLDAGLKAYCGMPLVAKGRLRGVLEVFCAESRLDDPEWVALLETLAGQAAIAIETYNLFSDLKRSNNDLVLAYDRTL
ncbi:MAG: GAF domain-containing protein, partial [Chloroflexota bacterium]